MPKVTAVNFRAKKLNDLSKMTQELVTQLSLELHDHCPGTFLPHKAPSGVWWLLRANHTERSSLRTPPTLRKGPVKDTPELQTSPG